MISMIKYELKKVFARTSSKIALLLLLVVTGITCYLAADVAYVDKNGETKTGRAAMSALKEAQQKWSGNLDEAKIRKVIAENNRIQETPEAHSNSVQDKNIVYSQKQGIQEIEQLLNCAFAKGFRDYDYYRVNSLTGAQASDFYSNRILLLKTWLSKAAKSQFTDAEKVYLISQYERIRTPFYYDYMKGWTQLFKFVPTIAMITMLILGYLIAGIFSNEFTWKSDAIFFTCAYGRGKAIRAKIRAGFCIVTLVYFATLLIYSAVTLFYLGAEGGNCMVQANWTSWKCFYNITVWQKYLLILLGGYIGCLFISFLSMLVSAKTKSAVLAVMLPFILVFIPSFMGDINNHSVSWIRGLLPDQLLQMGTVLDSFQLYTIGKRVVGAVAVLLVLYTALTIIVTPIVYQVYRRKQIK